MRIRVSIYLIYLICVHGCPRVHTVCVILCIVRTVECHCDHHVCDVVLELHCSGTADSSSPVSSNIFKRLARADAKRLLAVVSASSDDSLRDFRFYLLIYMSNLICVKFRDTIIQKEKLFTMLRQGRVCSARRHALCLVFWERLLMNFSCLIFLLHAA